MLKGIPEIIPPDLMKALMQMGHGDDIVFGDINFPSYSMGANGMRCVYAKGHRITDLMDAILDFMPLDVFVDDSVTLMRPGGTYEGFIPPIWEEYRTIIEAKDFSGAFNDFHLMERFDFYERARKSFITVQTSEDALYACMILRKGIIG
jgi:L-fucose mutarotase